ncbi:protein SSUH2 homolog [Anneissia japonica]|uniref:protein SSUH2 homolog n=1 Tax=Anneissia japonica TaxID=1529436 RepID=UPI00142587EE|nr:protein SSUH2 homolog [Anneissia japonica]
MTLETHQADSLPGMPNVEANAPVYLTEATEKTPITYIGQPHTNSSTANSKTNKAWTLPLGEATSAAYSWPDAPDSDVVDNPNAKEPSYQMTQALQAIPGYETTTVRKGKPHKKKDVPISRDFQQKFQELPAPLSKADAHGVLKDHVSHKCCYGKRVINDLEVDKVINVPVHQYKLSTFTETRQTIRLFEPFKGQKIDNLNNPFPPTIWEVKNSPDSLWKKHTKKCTVPQSSTIETCHGCTGRGFNKCYRCLGRGTTKCKKCKGTGKAKADNCLECAGSGNRRCQLCRGHACIVCSVCQGYKQLHFYIQLISDFNVLEDEVWLNATKVSTKSLQKLKKSKVIETENIMVSPIINYSFGDVNNASDSLVTKHSKEPTKCIIQQRHVLFALPVVEGQYVWKRRIKSFWVYGHERLVYAPEYPESCCGRCACTIV